MNFKDVYKSANNRIPANKEILNALLENNNKKSWYGYFPRVAASLAVVVIIFAVAFLNSPTSNDVQNNKIVLKKESATSANDNIRKGVTTSKTTVEENVAPKTNEISESPGTAEVVRENDNVSVPITRETQPVYDEQIEETPIAGNNSDSEHTDDLIPPSQPYFDGSIKSGGGGGSSGGASYRMAMDKSEKTAELLSCENYFEYIGLSIKKDDTLLSKNISLSFPDSYSVTKDEHTGETIDDSVIFTFSSQLYPEVAATMMMGKVNPPQIVGDLQIIANHKVYMQESNDVIYAHFIIEDVWFSLASSGLQQHEVVTLLSEFLTNKIS